MGLQETPTTDQRRAPRVAKTLEISYSSGTTPTAARIDDLSATGMFVDTHHPLTVGQSIDFSFQFTETEDDAPVRGRGQVVWAEPMVGVGVRFTHMTARDQERIKYFVAAVLFGHVSGNRVH
ncbi:MAG: PilZ domain-containing protein [Acidobacteriota bacterium]